MAWNGSGGAADSPRSGERRRAAGCGAKPRQVPSAWAKGPLRGALAALVVVVGAGLAWWLVSRPASTEPAPGPAHGKPAAVPKPVAPKPAKASTTNAQAKAEKPAKPEPPPFQKRPGAMQLPNGKILTFPPPKEGEIRKVYANGRMYECDHLGNFKDVTKRKLFKTAFELNFLAFAQEGKPYIPVFLKGLEEDEVKKVLLKNYTPIGDETEEEWAELKAYDNMRCAALDYMDQGGKFDDFVDEYAKFDSKQRETRAMGLREIMTLYKEGKVEEAKQMAEAANKLMEKQGFKPVQLPPHVQEAFDNM